MSLIDEAFDTKLRARNPNLMFTAFDPFIHNKADDSPEIAGNFEDFKPTKGQFLLMIHGGGMGACPCPNCPCQGQYHQVRRRQNRIRIKRRRHYGK